MITRGIGAKDSRLSLLVPNLRMLLPLGYTNAMKIVSANVAEDEHSIFFPEHR